MTGEYLIVKCEVGSEEKCLRLPSLLIQWQNFEEKKAINFHVAFSLKTPKVNYCVFLRVISKAYHFVRKSFL